jgi:hypothetical protein
VTGRAAAAALGFFAALAVVHTWPLASAPATLSRNDNGDTQLNEWIVSWIAHRLPREPLALFDANIFHPEPRTLAFSEPLLVPALVGAPIRWLGGSPVLTYNLLLLFGFALAGWAGYCAAVMLTGDRPAGLLAGSLIAFNAQTLTRLPHLQAHWAFGMPLALVLLDRLIASPRRRTALLLGACVALLALTSGYWGALAAVALATAALARAGECWRARRSLAPQLLLAGAVALSLALPPLLPYWRAHREQGLTRTPAETAAFASRPENYLSTPARIHYATWSRGFFASSGGSYFPGVLALALAAAALARGALRSGRGRALALVGGIGFLLSLGPATPLYALLQYAFPPMRGLRDPSRFGYLALLAISLLAALGLAEIRRRLAPARAFALSAAAVALANVEALCAPLSLVRFGGFSPVYARMAADPGPTVLAEFPLYPAAEIYRNASYVLASTQHWRPLVNGYSGFTPPSYARRAEILRDFPDAAALAELRALSVTHVVVHYGRYRDARAAAIRRRLQEHAAFTLVATGEGGEVLYRFAPAEPPS